MKKLLLFALSLSAIAISCNNNSKSDAEARHEADSIKISTAEGQRDSLMSLINEIGQNLSDVNQMENVMVSKDFQSETPERKQEILANISALREELANRRAKLDELEKKMKSSGNYNEKLRQTIDSQKKLIDEQTAKIEDLQRQLEAANVKIGQLASNVDSLNTKVSNVTAEKEAAEQRSEAISNELNTCYYVVGSNKELKEHNILEKKFLGKTKVMERDFDRSYFTKADKRTLKEIRTYSQKVKILTKQPVSSYEILEEGSGKVIKITNPTIFWEKSNFLVIETK